MIRLPMENAGRSVRIFSGGGGDVLRRVVVDVAGHLTLSLSALDLDREP